MLKRTFLLAGLAASLALVLCPAGPQLRGVGAVEVVDGVSPSLVVASAVIVG